MRILKYKKLLAAGVVLTTLFIVRYALLEHAKYELYPFDWDTAPKTGGLSTSGELGSKFAVTFGPRSAVDESVSRATPLLPPCSSDRPLVLQYDATPPPCTGIIYSWVFNPATQHLVN